MFLFLGTDLDNKAELKHDYLQDAIMCLNLNDPIVNHNKNAIITQLQNDLTNYISSHPSQDKITKSMRVLLMATKSLGQSEHWLHPQILLDIAYPAEEVVTEKIEKPENGSTTGTIIFTDKGLDLDHLSSLSSKKDL